MYAYGEVKQRTPCFIVDEKLLRDNIEVFRGALEKHWGRTAFGYSCKTNSLPYILHFVKEAGGYLEVVSDTEYDLARRMGCRDDHIIFNGPTKGRDHFFRALHKGAFVNLDSRRELAWLEEYDRSIPQGGAGVGLRVNFDLEAVCPEESLTGGGGNRFGYNVENGDFGRAVSLIKELKHVHVAGLHMHTNSKTRSLKVFEELAEKAGELSRQYDLALSYVDIGGSFFVRKGDFGAFERYAQVIGKTLSKWFDPSRTTLMVEPGSAVVSTPIRFLTKVLDVKDTNRHRFVVTDGGRMFIDPFMRKSSYVYWTEPADGKEAGGERSQADRMPEQIVCGHTCMETDRLMTLLDEPELTEGDYIVYDMTGGYTMALNPLFIEYFPDVFVERDGGYEPVREKWGVTEYLQRTKTVFSSANREGQKGSAGCETGGGKIREVGL